MEIRGEFSESEAFFNIDYDDAIDGATSLIIRITSFCRKFVICRDREDFKFREYR